MLKKLNSLLNIIMGSSVGVFIGHTLFEYSRFRKYPDLYAMQSAPWYTSTVIYGAVTAAIVLISLILKIFAIKKNESNYRNII